MFTSFRLPSPLIRLAAAFLLCWTGTTSRGSVQAAGITPEAALVRVLVVRPIQPAWFAPTFLARISVAQVQQVVTSLTAQLGTFKSVAVMPGGTFRVRFRDGTASAQIHLDQAGRIDLLGFANLQLTHVPSTIPGTSSASPATRAAAIDGLLQRSTHDHLFSGSVLEALRGRVILDKGYGYADVARRVPNTITTAYRIGSISKQFAAAAVLQLQEAGRLSIHDHLCRYIRACPQAWTPITVQMLLTHTSGFPATAGTPASTTSVSTPITVEQGIDLLKGVPLDRRPGARFEYSNANYDLLGAIVAQVAHVPYADYLQRRILDPLALRGTGYDQNHPDPHLHAVGYSTWGVPAPYVDVSWLYAAGALYSTVGDLWRWDQAILNGVLLSKAATSDMLASHVTMCSGAARCGGYDKLAYGYGWVRGVLAGQPIVWHNGEVNGFAALNAVLPRQDITIVVLSNVQTSGVDGALGVQLAKIMLGVA
jgi:CubicO group peptidase (beta-lactamase class C family)